MRHRGPSAIGRRAHSAATGRHRAAAVPPYPWLRVAGSVSLATMVPVAGAWVAVGAIGFNLSGTPTSPDASGTARPAEAPNQVVRTASPSIVVKRSPSPSLDAVARAGTRTPLPRHLGEAPARVSVQDSTAGAAAKHRADQMPEPSPAPTVAGRHRADTGDQPSTAPSGDEQQDSGQHAGQHGGSEDGGSPESSPESNPGSSPDDSRGEGHAYGHDRSESNGHAYGHDEKQDGAGRGNGSAGGAQGGSQGSQAGGSQDGASDSSDDGSADSSDGSAGGGSNSSAGEPDHGQSSGQSNGQGNGQGSGHADH